MAKGQVLVIGDIHGRTIYRDIIEKESPDQVIFLGDFASSHHNISPEKQIEEFDWVINYKQQHPNTIILRGNHDTEAMGYYWAECYPKAYGYDMWAERKQIWLDNTQWVYIDEDLKTIFSHAGVSQIWMHNSRIKSVYEINNLEPSELFGFTPESLFDNFGNSVTQPPTWIRPQSLCKCNVIEWDQVVGHTPVTTDIINIRKATKKNRNIWLCDALDMSKYLIIDDNKFIPSELKK